MNDETGDSSRRYKGILTQNDREFLRAGEWDKQSSLDRDTRHRIRQRVVEALRDFHMLTALLPDKDIRLIFESVTSDPDLMSGPIAFSYLGINLIEHEGDDEADAFANAVQRAIEVAIRQQGLIAHADVSIETNPENPNPEDLREVLLSNNGTIAQLQYLIDQGEDEPILEAVAESMEVMAVEMPSGTYELTPKVAKQILEHRRASEESSKSADSD